MPTPEAEYQRFTQQAGWTKAVRDYACQQTSLKPGDRVLEVGCGEGVILADLALHPLVRTYGLDLRLPALQFARQKSAGEALLACGDACRLPFSSGFFDITLCHFTLLWLRQPLEGLREMARVTRSGGWVAALAEPDYGGRIDYPETLAPLGKLQGEALSRQGADPNLGRQLGGLLHQAGLKDIQTGVLGGQWSAPFSQSEWAGEWAVLESDLKEDLTREALGQLRQQDWTARQKGERTLFVPTFYGWGKTPSFKG